MENEKEKRKKKKKPKRKKGGKSDRGEKEKTWEKRKKGGEKKRGIFPAFRRSNLNDPRVKVDPRNESYAWVPKSWSFVKLQEVENFFTLIISSLKVI